MRQALARLTRSLTMVAHFGLVAWLIAMIIVWTSAITFLVWNQQRAEGQLREMARTMAATLATLVDRALATGQEEDLRLMVQEAARQPDVAFIRVRYRPIAALVTAGDPATSPPGAVDRNGAHSALQRTAGHR